MTVALGLAAATLSTSAAGGAPPPYEKAAETCERAPTVITDVTDPADWSPLNPSKWAFENDEVIQVERGTAPDGPRRPFEYAVLAAGPEFGSLSYRAQVRIDEPIARNDRDVVLIFNYRSPTRFYYAHLSQDNTIYPHNGIFVVDNADRVRIDDQWDEGAGHGAPPAIDDLDWHDVRLDYAADTGDIAVHVDGVAEPLMTATDTTFSGGRVAFGSFDNYGRVRDVTVTGHRIGGPPPVRTSTHARSLGVGGGAVVVAKVQAHRHVPRGCVSLSLGDEVIATADLHRGRAWLHLEPGTLSPGRHRLTVGYPGSDDAAPSSTNVTIRIRR